MKKLFTLLVGFAFIIGAYSQVPERMSYQAVIRDASNELVTNQEVGMQISILQGSATGTAVYVETQTKQTNENGLVTIGIGGGIIVTGTFADINWATGTYFIKTETDPSGSTNYTITGTSQVLSVPYAFHSKTSETAPDAVKITGDQTISGNKTFIGTTTVSTPVNATDAVTKTYVDNILKSLGLIHANFVGTISDIEGNIYKTVKIGDQIWMAENLKTTKYRNGDLIATTSPYNEDIQKETDPKYQWAYDGVESNVTTFGRLYTWYAVTDSRNVCPTGWHMPSHEELISLINFLIANGYNYDGTTNGDKIAKSLASTSGWNSSSIAGAVGNTDYPEKRNATGFTALPGGARIPGGTFQDVGNVSIWWSAKETAATTALNYLLQSSESRSSLVSTNKTLGLSVRCLKD